LRGFKLAAQSGPCFLSRPFLDAALGDAVTPGHDTQRTFAGEIIRFATQPNFVCDAHNFGNEPQPKDSHSFPAAQFSSFPRIFIFFNKTGSLTVETISFPVSFPFVSRFRAKGCCDGNERQACPVRA
jgi:hypothetical protein